MRIVRAILFASTLLCACPALAQDSDLVEESGFLRVTVGGRAARLEALTVKRAGATGKLPIALVTHGKPTTQGSALDQRSSDYVRQARDLARRGWLAVVVMRRGFGGSDGPAPVPLTCASTSLLDRFSADADDLAAALEAIGRRPEADPSRMIAIGVSAGGAAVTALSARNPKGLAAVINVSGGLRFTNCPKEDALVAAFKEYGMKSRVPSLWIYAKNDSFFPPALVDRMQGAFLDGGGDVKLVMLEAEEKTDGHFIFGLAAGRFKWLPQMDAFLRFHKLPTWSRDDVNALMKNLGAKEASRGFLENYVSAPSERALARQKSGTYLGQGYGARTLEDARKVALEICEKRSQPCEILMENHRWIGPTQ
jgi:dienelactone hydrolase